MTGTARRRPPSSPTSTGSRSSRSPPTGPTSAGRARLDLQVRGRQVEGGHRRRRVRHEAGQPVLVARSRSRSRSACRLPRPARRRAPHSQRQAPREGGLHRRPGGRTGAVTLATTWRAEASTSCSAAPRVPRPGGDVGPGLGQRRLPAGAALRGGPAAYEAEYEPLLEAKKAECAEEHERVVDAGGLYILGTSATSPAASTTSSEAAPGARETRRHPLLPLARRRSHALLRHRDDLDGDGATQPAGGHADRVEDGLEGHRAGAEPVEGQNYELRKNVLKYGRGDEPPARGRLRAAPAAPRGGRPLRQGAGVRGRDGRERHQHLRQRGLPPRGVDWRASRRRWRSSTRPNSSAASTRRPRTIPPSSTPTRRRHSPTTTNGGRGDGGMGPQPASRLHASCPLLPAPAGDGAPDYYEVLASSRTPRSPMSALRSTAGSRRRTRT